MEAGMKRRHGGGGFNLGLPGKILSKGLLWVSLGASE